LLNSEFILGGEVKMEVVKVTDIPGIKIGNAQDLEAGTGCTVILCEQGAVAGVDVRGGSPGTRETDLLKSENQVDKVHGVFLAGGSAFGLDAAAGIMQFLEEKGIGFDTGIAKVPIVTGAILFDLICGDYRVRPDKAMGYQACVAAQEEEFSEGSVGAGTGATVGKFFGLEHAMKGGLGSYCIQTGNLMVGAVVAVNCLGDVIDPDTGRIIAGAYKENPFSFMSTEEGMIEYYSKMTNVFSGNTTIGAVITNAALTKTQANKVASMAHNGYARTIRPSHTMFDGDTIFVLSAGKVEADISVVGLLGARVIGQAVVNAVKKAAPLFGFKAYGEVF
jgi:L-aminopeptidase/D-esterase-like protein